MVRARSLNNPNSGSLSFQTAFRETRESGVGANLPRLRSQADRCGRPYGTIGISAAQLQETGTIILGIGTIGARSLLDCPD